MNPLTIGVLALQGDFREHLQAVHACGAEARPVRRRQELIGLDGLILPGGESTALERLIRVSELTEPLQEFIRSGTPVYGTCAGMILLADELLDPAVDGQGRVQTSLGGLDIAVRRNAFGRQRDSFEATLQLQDPVDSQHQESVTGVFIRAPWVERTGPKVQVLATVDTSEGQRPVAVASGSLMATSFHPELLSAKVPATSSQRSSGDSGFDPGLILHRMFIRLIGERT